MGASSFETTIVVAKDTSDKDAFQTATERARFENGHGGYSGTLAEKRNFTMIARAKSRENAECIVNAIYSTEGHGVSIYGEAAAAIIDDKWGPAGAIRYPIDAKNDGIIFFGYASS